MRRVLETMFYIGGVRPEVSAGRPQIWVEKQSFSIKSVHRREVKRVSEAITKHRRENIVLRGTPYIGGKSEQLAGTSCTGKNMREFTMTCLKVLNATVFLKPNLPPSSLSGDTTYEHKSKRKKQEFQKPLPNGGEQGWEYLKLCHVCERRRRGVFNTKRYTTWSFHGSHFVRNCAKHCTEGETTTAQAQTDNCTVN